MWNFLYSSLCPPSPVLSLGTTEKYLALLNINKWEQIVTFLFSLQGLCSHLPDYFIGACEGK